MSKSQQLQAMIRLYKEQSGASAVTMREVADFAINKMGWHVPPPMSAVDRLAQDLSRAAREETRYSKATKRPYRAYHAVPGMRDGEQMTLWYDMDEAPRAAMQQSLTLRRQQMIDDGYHLACDADHWNATHLSEQPIQISFDFRNDVEERKLAANDEEEAV